VKSFVDWLLAQRLRLVIAAVVVAPLLPLVSAALIVVETARRGTAQGLVSAGAACAGLVLLAALARADVSVVATIGGISMLSGVAVGALLRRTQSLVFAFQLVMLGCFALVVLNSLVGPDPQVLFGPLLREFEAVMQSPAYTPQDVADVTARLAQMLPAVTLFSSLVGALLLGYWWWTLAEGESRFGKEFRELRLGLLLGAGASAIAALGLALSAPLVQNLTPLAWLAFGVQGLAVVHAVAHARRWHSGILVLLYLLLVMPPLTVFVMFPVGVVGLIDTWLNLRKRLRAA
jgi:hypothetical protein